MPYITTNGVASTEVVPDIATISVAVDTERPNAAAAARDNARAVQAMIGEIKAQGIEAKDIKTLPVTLSPGYDEVHDANGNVTKRTLRGYAAHNSLSVRIKDITKAGVLAGQLMDKGTNSFERIVFDYSQKEAKYDALRGDAVRDALRKANSYVTGLGLKLGRVLEIVTQQPVVAEFGGIGGFGEPRAPRPAHRRCRNSRRAWRRDAANRSPSHLGTGAIAARWSLTSGGRFDPKRVG